jgi:hypothetical protein
MTFRDYHVCFPIRVYLKPVQPWILRIHDQALSSVLDSIGILFLPFAVEKSSTIQETSMEDCSVVGALS